MSNQQSFQRFTGVAAIVSFLLALASNILQGLPLNFSSDVFSNPAVMLHIGANGARLLRLGMILDMLGYYLPLLPVAIFLQSWCGPLNRAWVQFYTLCGVSYIIIGAAGAATLAAVLPSLIMAYGQAASAQRVVLETIFSTMWNMVYGGLWNILGQLLGGVWLVGIGWFLQGERRIFSIVSMILGIAALLNSAGMILGIEIMASLGLVVFLGLAPIWALWLGIDLLHKPVAIATN